MLSRIQLISPVSERSLVSTSVANSTTSLSKQACQTHDSVQDEFRKAAGRARVELRGFYETHQALADVFYAS